MSAITLDAPVATGATEIVPGGYNMLETGPTEVGPDAVVTYETIARPHLIPFASADNPRDDLGSRNGTGETIRLTATTLSAPELLGVIPLASYAVGVNVTYVG